MSFAAWIAEIDKQLVFHFEMDSRDLPDYHWHDLYDAGVSPIDAFIDYMDFLMAESDLPEGFFYSLGIG